MVCIPSPACSNFCFTARFNRVQWLRDSRCSWVSFKRYVVLSFAMILPRRPQSHLFNDPEDCWALLGVVGVQHGSGRETFLIRVRVFSTAGGPHLVDRAAVVASEER